MTKHRLLVINEHEASELARRATICLSGKKIIAFDQIEETQKCIAEAILQLAKEKNNRIINFGSSTSAAA
jgi:hypothetical protein